MGQLKYLSNCLDSSARCAPICSIFLGVILKFLNKSKIGISTNAGYHYLE
jgi:hypothetical protein